jgi:hypothetical protein
VLRPDGDLVAQRRARVWVAANVDSPPVAQATAELESITVPGADVNALGSTVLYVSHLNISRPGSYSILVRPVNSRVTAVDHLLIGKTTKAPAVGARAFPSPTPTIASSGGDLHRITTHVPPDTALLRYSVAASSAAHAPFVLAFASPAICLNRTCGPVVDVVEAVRRELHNSRIRFIHVEPFVDNNPGLGFNRFARQWRLPSEPFLFLVGADGKIKAKFEGSASIGELARAVSTYLAHP